MQKVLLLCVAEGLVTTAAAAILILSSGKFLLSLFNSDPQVIDIGYTRLVIIFSAYIFSLLYEIMSGYLRGFGISLSRHCLQPSVSAEPGLHGYMPYSRTTAVFQPDDGLSCQPVHNSVAYSHRSACLSSGPQIPKQDRQTLIVCRPCSFLNLYHITPPDDSNPNGIRACMHTDGSSDPVNGNCLCCSEFFFQALHQHFLEALRFFISIAVTNDQGTVL